MAHKRVLVFMQRASDIKPVQVHFTQSVLDAFDIPTNTHHEMYLKARLENNRLLMFHKDSEATDKEVKIRRPSFCPIHNLTPDRISSLPLESLNRGVDSGVATIVESSDGQVFLQRRAKHLRTFPGVWVPPGGHIEFDETLHEAGLRELQEESGLEITDDMCVNNQIPVLAMWESVYPPMLSAGDPKRHHIVVYLHAKLKPPYTSEKLQTLINLDPEEVGACAWLDRKTVSAIVDISEEKTFSGGKNGDDLPEMFKAILVDTDRRHVDQWFPLQNLLNKATGEEKDIERVSTGTRFALEEWIKNNKTTGENCS